MAATRKESWDTGGLTFYQPAVGIGGGEAEDVWDDGAILKAFDDALSTHSRKPGAEARKWKKHAIQAAGGQAPLRGMTNHPMGAGYGSHGFQQPESRFASLLAKGNTEGAASRRTAGIPGPWEPVTRESEGSHRGMHQHDAGQRYDSGRGGGYDYSYYRGEEYGTHHNPYLNGPNMPSNGNAGGFEEGWERPGIPPPPAPPLPSGGLGLHAAAHQSLEGVLDDDLADLLLAWYYSGYYTGRYWAIQEARTPRFRRRYPPMGPPVTQGMPASSTVHFGAESWERQGWHQQAAPAPGQSPASRNAGKRPGP